MPGIEDSLKAALLADETVAGLIGERCYAGTVPPHTSPTPWVYFSVTNEAPADDLIANAADRWEVDIELYADTYLEVRALKRAVRGALDRYRGGQIRRCMWDGGDAAVVEGGHNWTERYIVWGSDPTIVPTAGATARIVTGDGVIYLYPTGGTLPVVSIDSDGVIHGDGSGLTDLPQPDLSGYQPLNAGLTAIAALSTTSIGRGLLTLADAAAIRSYIGAGVPLAVGGTITGATAGRDLYVGSGGVLAEDAGSANLTTGPRTITGSGNVDQLTLLNTTYNRSIRLGWENGGATPHINADDSIVMRASNNVEMLTGGHTYGITFGSLSANDRAMWNQVGDLILRAMNATFRPLIVRGAAAQTADLTQWQDSAGTVISAFKSSGAWQPASMADGTAAVGTVYYSTTAAKLVYKDSSGTVHPLY